MLWVRLFAAALLPITAPAVAHGGEHGAPGWTLDPLLVVPLLAVLLVYLVGHHRLKFRSTAPRPWGRFVGGWSVLALALVSPLHEAGERSFTLHMIEHELIMLVATLLLASAHAGGALAWGLPRALRPVARTKALTATWRALTEPVTATVVQGLVMWVWHMPALFDRALEQPGWHVAQHGSFLLASLLFWSAMFAGRDRRRYGAAAACLFLTSLIGGALGALMSLSASPWYEPYARLGVSGLGLDPVADQQLAGLVMWIPGGLVHAGAALGFFYRWMSAGANRHALA